MKQSLTVTDLKEYVKNVDTFKKVIEKLKIEWFSAGQFDKSWLEELASNIDIGVLLDYLEKSIDRIEPFRYTKNEPMEEKAYINVLKRVKESELDLDIDEYIKEKGLPSIPVNKFGWHVSAHTPSFSIRKEELIDALWILMQAKCGRWKELETDEC